MKVTETQTGNALIKFGITLIVLLIVMTFQGCSMETEGELAVNTFLQEMNPELAKKIVNIEEEISLTHEKMQKLSELKLKHPKYADKIETSRQKWEQLQHQLKDTLKKIRTIVESSYVAYELDQIQGGNQFNNISEKLLTSANSVLTSAHTTKEAIDDALYELENSSALFATEEEPFSLPDSAAEIVEVEEKVSETTSDFQIGEWRVEQPQTVEIPDTILSPSTIKSNSSNRVLPTKLSKVLTGHSGDVNAVAFSPNGRIIASGSNDNTVKLWEVNTGKEISTLSETKDDVLTVAFHPDGYLIAAGGNDQTIHLWDINTNEKTGTLVGHEGVIYSIAFSPDGQTLVSGSWDKNGETLGNKHGYRVTSY
ncbi:WD-40 repeat protein [Beggiatoa sp. PS]|nr:WD-40 repeat protein [Beggiatoa sp. PS]